MIRVFVSGSFRLFAADNTLVQSRISAFIKYAYICYARNDENNQDQRRRPPYQSFVIKMHLIRWDLCTGMMLRVVSAPEQLLQGSEDNGGQRWKDPTGQIFHPLPDWQCSLWYISLKPGVSAAQYHALRFIYLYTPVNRKQTSKGDFLPPCFQNNKKFLGEAD